MIVYGDAGFREYLEAKFSIDSESLNRKTLTQFAALLKRAKSPVLLDLGTGTGAMIRRIIEAELVPEIVFYGIDANRDLLETGRQRISDLLRAKGYAAKGGDQIITASKPKHSVEIHLVSGNLFDSKLRATLEPIPFSGVVTHAFMDNVPLDLTLQVLNKLLPRGGFFYSTINYDGTTEMFPFFADRAFEQNLLTSYNRSMDERPSEYSDGSGNGTRNSGGSRTGSLLYDRILQNGFRISGFGSSDWSIFPWNGSYTKPEEVFLNSLVLTMYEEGLRHPELDRYTLSAWYADRSQSIEERTLSLITHQTDLLAVKR